MSSSRSSSSSKKKQPLKATNSTTSNEDDEEITSNGELSSEKSRGSESQTTGAGYSVGEKVLVRVKGTVWPAVVEDGSNVQETVTRSKIAVFLYGIHERRVCHVVDVLSWEEDLAAVTEQARQNRLLNLAMKEAELYPDVNLRILPPHKLQGCRLSEASDGALERYLLSGDANPCQEETIPDTDPGDLFQDHGQSLVMYDRVLSYLTIGVCSFFLLYLTWWLVLLPFLQADYLDVLDAFFPHPSAGLAYPVAVGTILTSSAVALFGAVTYGPRVRAHLFMNVEAAGRGPSICTDQDRWRALEDSCRRRPAIAVTTVLTIVLLTPIRTLALSVIILCSFYLIKDFLRYV